MLITSAEPRTAQLDQIFSHLGGALDITSELRAEAVRLYETVAAELAHQQSKLAHLSPEIFPQGSFRLGTMIRPVLRGCEYDVDLVCLLFLLKEATTQAKLKELVGDELARWHEEILDAGRRCWTLQFNGKFHMDVLPCIPDLERGGTAILLTDKDLRLWQHSDPRAYASWFEGRMAVVMRQLKEALAYELRASVDEIPDWQVRTPLQRVVQLLKRHRDLFFFNHLDRRPASIIITTLAAAAYNGETSIADALTNAVTALRAVNPRADGKYYIPNPVNPKENFADRWNEHPERALYFSGWIVALADDVAKWSRSTGGVHHLSEAMAPAFGSDVVKRAMEGYGESLAVSRKSGTMRMTGSTGMLVGTSTPSARSVPVRPHTFFGE